MRNTLVLLFLLTCLPACVNSNINQFQQFSDAGAAYSDTMMLLTLEAGNAAIDADSQILIKNRGALNESERSDTYLDQTKSLQGLLTELRLFRQHTHLLAKYFRTLAKLSDQNIQSGLAESSTLLLTDIQALRPNLEKAEIGGAKVKDLLPAATRMITAAFQNKALENELRANAATIGKELNLQNAFLKALAVGMEADINVIINLKSFQDVAKPYIKTGTLPKSWIEKRRELLTSTVMLSSVANARNAADDLHSLFVALVENKAGPSDIEAAFQSIGEMIDLIEIFKKS
ncbi:MAG: hypothetical protein HKN85_07385 [Gammaproteobacteria bacterium]|nr:hypothetical protein [Gammaproteobacteria bacterium]